MAEILKIPDFSEIWTRIAEFKLQIAIHYFIEPIKKSTKIGYEPTRAETNVLSFHRFNHSAIFVHKRCDQTVFLYVYFKRQISIS